MGEENTVIGAAKKKAATKTSKKTEDKMPKVSGRSRVPMHSQVTQTVPDEALDPNFEYRWCTDYNKGKIERYLAAGWEFVLDKNQNRIERAGGDALVLMKLPKEYAEEDRLAKKAKIIDTNTKFKEDHRAKDSDDEDVPEYLVKEQNLL